LVWCLFSFSLLSRSAIEEIAWTLYHYATLFRSAALNDLLDDPHRTLAELARRLDAAEAAREHHARRLLQQRAFAALTQAVRPIS
jgi:hypothetical protein